MKKMKNPDINIYKQIVENISDGIVLCNCSFEIIYTNDAFLNLTKYDKNEIIGKKFSSIISEDMENSGLFPALFPEISAHHGKLTDKQGKTIPVKLIRKTIFNGSEEILLIILCPLTELINLNQAHIDFVSTVSHELRTPLTSIKGFADTLLSAGDRITKEQQTRFISIIKSQADRLTRLVEDLLTVSRLESKKDNSIYKAIDLEKLLEPIIQGIQTKALNHKFKVLLADKLPCIWADSDKLEQVLTNLIDNAVKYSFPDTVVTITANYSPNNTAFIDISVTDEGVGIPDEMLPNIFNKFSRIDNPLTREVQGTGLGLYITKSLVEKMGGRIFAGNNKTGKGTPEKGIIGKGTPKGTPKGTTFTVQMPAATCEIQTSQKFLH